MRVVLDTNVIISGLLWSGTPRQALDAAKRGDIQIFTTVVLLEELRDVLQREKFAVRLTQAGVDSDTLISGIQALAILIEPQVIAPTIRDDPDDDAVLACAVAAKARFIVSGDRHLLTLAEFSGIPILNAAEFLNRLNLRAG